MSSGKKTLQLHLYGAQPALVVPHRDVATGLLQHRNWLGTRFAAWVSFLLIFTNYFIRVRENRELEEGTVIEFVVEKEEEEEMVIPEEDDTWMLNIDDQDAVLLAAACDSNGEHGMHVIYAYMHG